MRKNLYLALLLLIVNVVLFGCGFEKKEHDIDKIVEELVESTKHHAEQPIDDKSENVQNDPPPENTTSLAEETTDVKEVRISPFGFGPYPEIPTDFPIQNIFDQSGQNSPNFELMDRVWVELWKRGVRGITGMSISNESGLVHPTIQGIMYVNWEPRWELFGFGFGRRISGISGHPDDFGEPFGPDEPKIPKGIKVFDMSEGIDPYKLLNLPKK